MRTLEPKDDDDIDGDEILNAFNLDPRLIEQSKALAKGELASYQKMRKQLDLMPTSMKVVMQSEGDETVVEEQLELLKSEAAETQNADEADKEIQAEIEAIMQDRLKRTVNEKVKALEPMKIKDALQTVQEMNQQMKKANLQTLNELIDEFLSGDDKTDISPLLLVYDQLKEHSKL